MACLDIIQPYNDLLFLLYSRIIRSQATNYSRTVTKGLQERFCPKKGRRSRQNLPAPAVFSQRAVVVKGGEVVKEDILQQPRLDP